MLRAEAARQIATQDHVKRGRFEIDPGCEVSAVPTGIWVQCWVFVSAKDIDAVLSEEMEP